MKKETNTPVITGKWVGNYLTDEVILNFNKDSLSVIYLYTDTISSVSWKYKIQDNFLFLINSKQEKQTHVVQTLTNDRLRLVPEGVNLVDIPIIDAIDFERKNDGKD